MRDYYEVRLEEESGTRMRRKLQGVEIDEVNVDLDGLDAKNLCQVLWGLRFYISIVGWCFDKVHDEQHFQNLRYALLRQGSNR